MDDAGLTPAEMRVFVHLLRSADNQSGIAWPSFERMVKITGMSRATIARAITGLEGRQLVKKMGKPFGGSSRYRIAQIVSNESRLNESNSLISEQIESSPIVSPENCNMQRDETSIVSPESKEGNPKKVIQRRESNSCAIAIFDAYPRKDAKKSALTAIEKALKRNPAEYLLERTRIFAEASKGKEIRFIPHGATFFNQERFNDDPETWKQSHRKQGRCLEPMSLEDAKKLLGGRANYLTD